MAKEEKGLAIPESPSTAVSIESLVGSQGFIEDVTIKVGNPADGCIPTFVGQLIGASADVELNDGEGTMPVWSFHPLIADGKGAISVDKNRVVNVICSAMLDSAYKRAAAMSQATGKKIQVGAVYTGIGKNRTGQPLNQFRTASRLVD